LGLLPRSADGNWEDERVAPGRAVERLGGAAARAVRAALTQKFAASGAGTETGRPVVGASWRHHSQETKVNLVDGTALHGLPSPGQTVLEFRSFGRKRPLARFRGRGSGSSATDAKIAPCDAVGTEVADRKQDRPLRHLWRLVSLLACGVSAMSEQDASLLVLRFLSPTGF